MTVPVWNSSIPAFSKPFSMVLSFQRAACANVTGGFSVCSQSSNCFTGTGKTLEGKSFEKEKRNLPNQKKKGKKSYSRIEKLTPWLELWVIESPVVTMMKMKVVLPFAVPSAKKERNERNK